MARPGSSLPGRGNGGSGPRAGRPSASFQAPASDDNPWLRAAQRLEKARAPKAEPEPTPTRRADGRLLAGRLGAPRGVEGDLRVHSYSGESSHLLALKTLELVHEGPGGRETRLRVEVSRVLVDEGGGLSLRFKGYESPELALRLVGMEILVERAQAAPLGEGEWYITDLVGLEAVPPGGGPAYGRVVAVCGGGPDPWLELELPAGAAERRLVPFRKEFVGDIDLAAGTLVLLAPWVLE